MTNIPSAFFKSNGMTAHIIGLPLFMLGFLSLFRPYGIYSIINANFGRYSFHITMLMCITLVVILISRMIMLGFRQKIKNSWMDYIVWEIAESIFIAGFSALYLYLILRNGIAYFEYLGYSILFTISILSFPYAIIGLYLSLIEEREINTREQDSNNKIRFVDDKNNLKLMVAQESILYIQADENYLKIWYLNSGRITNFVLRNSMKKVEDLCLKNGLIRCHRSYYVNKSRVKILQKDKDGIYAQLDVIDAPRIPVSKNYYAHLSALL